MVSYADVVQLAERQLPKLNVAGSNPVIRSMNGYTTNRFRAYTLLITAMCVLMRGSGIFFYVFKRSIGTE